MKTKQNEKKQWCIVGSGGFIAPRHKNAINETGDNVLLTCDIDKTTKPDFIDWVEMIKSEKFRKVDSVAVLTPNYTHSTICRALINEGKKVLCEKPLTIFEDYKGLEDVNIVLQLRYNEKVKELKKRNINNIEIFVKTYREPKYFKSWKGIPEKSGGILWNMGIHYIDLLCYLLGKPKNVIYSGYSDKIATGVVEFEKGIGTYYIELSTEKCSVHRRLTVDGEVVEIEGATIPLSGGGVNLHTKVYEALKVGEGFKLEDTREAMDLVNKLKKI